MLAGVDLALEPGTITEVAGGNGSGKSTLLRIVAGLTLPTRGGVRLRPASLAYVPERLPALRMTAHAYVHHMAALRGIDPAPYEKLLERFDLSPSAGAAIGTLSKGNRQKVALTQALAPPARFVLLDEPASGLDVAARAVLRDVLDERRAAGATVLLATHHPVEGSGRGPGARTGGAGSLGARLPAPAQPLMRIELALGAGDPGRRRPPDRVGRRPGRRPGRGMVRGVRAPGMAGSYSGRATGGDVAAGVAAHLLVALFGVGIGAMGMRAVLGRAGYTVLAATSLCLADLLVPHAPPARRILEIFDDGAVGGLVPVALATAVLSAGLIAFSLGIARRRS